MVSVYLVWFFFRVAQFSRNSVDLELWCCGQVQRKGYKSEVAAKRFRCPTIGSGLGGFRI